MDISHIQENSGILKFIKTISAISILRTILLLLTYSTLFFYIFYYGHSNGGVFLGSDSWGKGTYQLYFLICLAISFLMFISPNLKDFSKNLLKITAGLFIIVFITMFIPVGWGSLGIVLFFEVFGKIFFLFVVSIVVYGFTSLFVSNKILIICLNIILLLPLSYFIYANNNDLSVKSRVQYQNNSMFKTIEECSAFIYKIRADDCRKDFTKMHDNWDLDTVKSNINLVSGQQIDSNSANYKFFPKENIIDLVVGTGTLATIGNTAIVNIISANIGGKEYDNLSLIPNTAYSTNYSNVKAYMYAWSGTSYEFGVIGMKVGGIRKITFKSPSGLQFTGAKPPILIKSGESIEYTVQLVSILPGLRNF